MSNPSRNQSRQHKQAARQAREAEKTEKANAEAKVTYERPRALLSKLEARRPNQKILIDLLKTKRIVFATGPAGTGKTFVVTSWAAEMLINKEIERIVITRPVVGCDEDMGFLPGTEEEKFEGWVDPFMEILEGKLGKSQTEYFIKSGKIVVKPLMRMRGATFRNSVVLLDEAQNTTQKQMKMFLTRIGQNGRLIINGDFEQSDLPERIIDGLSDAVRRISPSAGIGMVQFTEEDVVRDPLVKEILEAYRNEPYKTSKVYETPVTLNEDDSVPALLKRAA